MSDDLLALDRQRRWGDLRYYLTTTPLEQIDLPNTLAAVERLLEEETMTIDRRTYASS